MTDILLENEGTPINQEQDVECTHQVSILIGIKF